MDKMCYEAGSRPRSTQDMLYRKRAFVRGDQHRRRSETSLAGGRSSTNTVTITPNATLGDLINGATTSVLTTQYQSIQIMSNGIFYYLV